MENALNKCAEINNKEMFVEAVNVAIKPIWTLRKNNLNKFGEIAREATKNQIEKGGMIWLSKLIYYRKGNNYVHIHLAHAEDLKPHELIDAVTEGLQKLAKIVNDDKSIEHIEATSWIVAKE